MSAARSKGKEPSAGSPYAELSAAFDRHEKLLTSIDTHLDALVDLTTKERLGSPHLTVPQAAAYLSVSIDGLRKKMRTGTIPHHKRPGCRPYLLRHEIDAWLSDPGTCCPVRAEAEGLKECTDDNETVEKLLARAKPPKSRADRG